MAWLHNNTKPQPVPCPPPISQPVSCPHSSASLWHNHVGLHDGSGVDGKGYCTRPLHLLPPKLTPLCRHHSGMWWKELAEHHLEDLIGNQCSTESSCLDYPQGNPHTTLTLHPSHNSCIEKTPHTPTTFCCDHSDTVEQVATYCTQCMFDAI